MLFEYFRFYFNLAQKGQKNMIYISDLAINIKKDN